MKTHMFTDFKLNFKFKLNLMKTHLLRDFKLNLMKTNLSRDFPLSRLLTLLTVTGLRT